MEGTEEWEVESPPVHASSDREMEEGKAPEFRPHTPPDLRPRRRRRRRSRPYDGGGQAEEVGLHGEEVPAFPIAIST